MKKISISSEIPLLLLIGLLSGCAFTDYGTRISQEQNEVATLEDKRHKLEAQYIIVMSMLEKHPTDRALIDERDKVLEKLRLLTFDIDQKRGFFDQSLREWEQKLVQDRVQQEMIEQEVRENAHKDEGEFLTE